MSSQAKDSKAKEEPAQTPDAAETLNVDIPTMGSLDKNSIRVMKDASLAKDKEGGAKAADADEPQISEETAKQPVEKKKLTTLAFKIDPPIGYLPVVDGLVTKEQVKKLREDLRSQDMTKLNAARATIKDLKLAEAQDEAKKAKKDDRVEAIESVRLRLEYSECKALYQMGGYKECLELVIDRAAKLEAAYPDIKELGEPPSEVKQRYAKGMTKKDYEFSMDEFDGKPIMQVKEFDEDRISYIYLKYKLLEARI